MNARRSILSSATLALTSYDIRSSLPLLDNRPHPVRMLRSDTSEYKPQKRAVTPNVKDHGRAGMQLAKLDDAVRRVLCIVVLGVTVTE